MQDAWEAGWGFYIKSMLNSMSANQGVFSNMASDWLVAELPANQMSDMKILSFN